MLAYIPQIGVMELFVLLGNLLFWTVIIVGITKYVRYISESKNIENQNIIATLREENQRLRDELANLKSHSL